jgi:hypothetical protein
MERDDRLRGQASGLALIYERRMLTFGLTYLRGRRSTALAPSNRPYLFHRFEATSWKAASGFTRIEAGRYLHIAGEMAFDNAATPAGLFVLRAKPTSSVDLFLAYRNYPPSFGTPFGAPPGSTGDGSNERGWVVGMRWKGHRGALTVVRNLYRKPWLQHDSNRPSSFSTWGFEARARHGSLKWVARADLRLRNQVSKRRSVGAATFEHRTRWRLRLSYRRKALTPGLDVLLNRLLHEQRETGQAIGQRITWRPTRGLTLTTGVVFFSSTSGRSGVYLYEPSLPDYFSVPLLSGKGQRVYLLLEVGPWGKVTSWLKASFTRFAEERMVGSGVDAVLASQLRYIAAAFRLGL